MSEIRDDVVVWLREKWILQIFQCRKEGRTQDQAAAIIGALSRTHCTVGELNAAVRLCREEHEARLEYAASIAKKKLTAKQKRIATLKRRNWVRGRQNLGRPIDMGGPREVWLTFRVSPDPRLDNLEPVSA